MISAAVPDFSSCQRAVWGTACQKKEEAPGGRETGILLKDSCQKPVPFPKVWGLSGKAGQNAGVKHGKRTSE